MFPLVIRAQQNAARMANNMPQMAVLQEKMTQARLSGNQIEGNIYLQHKFLVDIELSKILFDVSN